MPLRRVLALDASMARAVVALLDDDDLCASRVAHGPHGIADALPGMVRDCLAEAAVPARALDAVAVTVGPGSFTGLRAAIALAHGIGFAAQVPVYGVTFGEAFTSFETTGRSLWIAVTARRGRVFIERSGVAASYAEDELPSPAGSVAIAGDQAVAVASRLAAGGHDVLLTTARYAEPAAIAQAARARFKAGLLPRPPVPAYIDPPEAKRPAQGLRPPPGSAAVLV